MRLEWKDIDWDNRIIYVRRTSNYTPERGIYTDMTKTKRSARSGRYPQLVFDLMKEYKVEQDEERAKLGDKWNDYDRLFVKKDGKPMNLCTPYAWLRTFCQKNDMRFCDIHSFRHLHASLLINAGVDVATVSADLGHSNSTTTVVTPYGHTYPNRCIRLPELQLSGTAHNKNRTVCQVKQYDFYKKYPAIFRAQNYFSVHSDISASYSPAQSNKRFPQIPG